MVIWDYDVHYWAITAQYDAEIFDCKTGNVHWCSIPMASAADCERIALAHLQR